MSLQQRLQSRLSFARMDYAQARKDYDDTPTPEGAEKVRCAKGAIVQADAALGACCRFPPVSRLDDAKAAWWDRWRNLATSGRTPC